MTAKNKLHLTAVNILIKIKKMIGIHQCDNKTNIITEVINLIRIINYVGVINLITIEIFIRMTF